MNAPRGPGRATWVPLRVALGYVALWLAVSPVARRAGPHQPTWAVVAFGLLSVAGMVSYAAFMIRGATGIERPDVFDRDGRHFVAPPSASFGFVPAAQVIFGTALAWILFQPDAPPPGSPPGLASLATLGLWAGLVAVFVTGLARCRPSVVLTQTAMELRGLLGPRTVSWDAVDPTRVRATDRALVAAVRPGAPVARRGLGGMRGGAVRLRQVRWLRIRPGFPGTAVRFYAANPGERAGIGTGEGHSPLLSAIREAAASTPDA